MQKKILRTNKINGEATLSDIVQEKEFLQRASFTSKEKRDEFARHADEMFAGSQHSGQYVITYGQKFEKPVKDVPKATIITLPRRSPASLGEPEFYRK